MKSTTVPVTPKKAKTILEKNKEEMKSRKRTKVPRRLFVKTMTLNLVGSSEEHLTEVAHAIHKLSHPLTAGGATNRKVQITCTNSTKPEMIYFGNV